MAEQTTQNKIIDNRLRSAKYANRNKLKNKVRRLARQYPLNDCCAFCGETEQLERAHIIYDLKHPELFVTTCKSCHEWADKKHEDTQILADNKRMKKEMLYVRNMKGSDLTFKLTNGYIIEGET